MLTQSDLIVPEWPAPQGVKAIFTTRIGGVSEGEFAGLNLGRHAGDKGQSVDENRRLVTQLLPAAPIWMSQVHGAHVADLDVATGPLEADAATTTMAGRPCAVMVADCLPVLFCTESGERVAAAHAGWRGLANGVLENTVIAMATPAAQIMAWLGPAIGPSAFEVGEDVVDAFVGRDPAARVAFVSVDNRPGKFMADLYLLARQRLAAVGVTRVSGGRYCTVSDPRRFFSYRRDGRTGRMAAIIWRV